MGCFEKKIVQVTEQTHDVSFKCLLHTIITAGKWNRTKLRKIDSVKKCNMHAIAFYSTYSNMKCNGDQSFSI
jgi:hypothetical protein